MPVALTRCHLRLAALVVLLVAGTAVAHEKATGVVAARMKAMEDTAAQAKALDRALKAATLNWSDIGTRTERIHAHAHNLLDLFPPRSDQGHTYARPDVWTKRGDFERLARTYDAETEKLVAVAAARTAPSLRQQFDVVRHECLACHEKFRIPGAERQH
jgi:cytochrome c556